MTIFILDDEKNAVELLYRIVSGILPEAQIYCFQNAKEAVEEAGKKIPDIIFSDIEMPELAGIEAARIFKEINPKINIIFVTGYANYMMKALDLHCSGYIMKPVSKRKVQEKLDNLLYPVEGNKSDLYVHTFGYFDLLKDGVAVKFRRKKSKELFALLIDRNGASVSNRWIAAYLFPEKNYDSSTKNYVTTIISELRTTLREIGAEDLILKSWGTIQLDRARIQCDFYEYLDGKNGAGDRFSGKYMEEYSWAEETKSMLYWKERQRS